MTTQLQDRYLLTVVRHRKPRAQKTDSKARKAIADKARDSGGSFADSKEICAGIIKLYSKDSIKSVETHYHAFNTFHQAVTCEYIGGRGSPRLLSILKQSQHADRFHSSFLAWQGALQQWLAGYAEEREKAQLRLGEFFDASDYPSPETIAQHWEFACQYMTIPDPKAFELGAFTVEQSNALQKQLIDAADRAAKDATREYRDRLSDALKHVSDQMRNGKRLHASMLSNLQDLATADLNVTDDSGIADALADIPDVITAGNSAISSREQFDKNAAAEKAEAINKKLAGLF